MHDIKRIFHGDSEVGETPWFSIVTPRGEPGTHEQLHDEDIPSQAVIDLIEDQSFAAWLLSQPTPTAQNILAVLEAGVDPEWVGSTTESDGWNALERLLSVATGRPLFDRLLKEMHLRIEDEPNLSDTFVEIESIYDARWARIYTFDPTVDLELAKSLIRRGLQKLVRYEPQTGTWYATDRDYWSQVDETTATSRIQDWMSLALSQVATETLAFSTSSPTASGKLTIVQDVERLKGQKGSAAEELAMLQQRCIALEASEDAEFLYAQCLVQQSIRLTWYRKEHRRVKDLVQSLKARPQLHVKPSTFDHAAHLLGQTDRIVNLRQDKTYAPNSRYMIRRRPHIASVQEAQCPLWEATLRHMFPVQEEYDFMQRALGYSITGAFSGKSIFILHGPTDTGKTLIQNVLSRVLGDVYCGLTPGTVFQEKNETHPTKLIALDGARMAVVEETSSSHLLDIEMVKAISGGGIIRARGIGKNFYSFPSVAKLWFFGNSIPSMDKLDDALIKRMVIIPMEVVIPEDEKDETLTDRIVSDEAAGVLDWLIAGAREWYAAGFSRKALGVPVQFELKKMRHVSESDRFGDFFSRWIEPSSNDHEWKGAAGMFELYQLWAKSSEGPKISLQRFIAMVRERGYVRHEHRNRAYYCLTILPEAQAALMNHTDSCPSLTKNPLANSPIRTGD